MCHHYSCFSIKTDDNNHGSYTSWPWYFYIVFLSFSTVWWSNRHMSRSANNAWSKHSYTYIFCIFLVNTQMQPYGHSIVRIVSAVDLKNVSQLFGPRLITGSSRVYGKILKSWLMCTGVDYTLTIAYYLCIKYLEDQVIYLHQHKVSQSVSTIILLSNSG